MVTTHENPFIDAMIAITGSYGAALEELGRRVRDDPNQAMNRITFAVDLANRLGLDTSDPSLAQETFNDVDGLTAQQLGAISALLSEGIVEGTSASTFSPEGEMMRSHAALMLDRAGFDSGEIFTQGTEGPLLGPHAQIVIDRLPEAPVGGTTTPQGEYVPAPDMDPLNDPRYAAFLAGSGVEISELEGSLELYRAQAQQRIDLLNANLQGQLAMAQTQFETSGSNAENLRAEMLQNAAARLALARTNAEEDLARAQGLMESRIASDAGVFDWERYLSQKKIFQDYESRGFFRSSARLTARDDAKTALDLQQAARDEANRQSFLNTQLGTEQAVRGAETQYGTTQHTAENLYTRTLASAQDALAARQLQLNQTYGTNYLSEQQGLASYADDINARIAAEYRERTLEEIDARRRLTEDALRTGIA